MLNELFLVEHGIREAGVSMAERRPDIKDVAHIPTLLVRLDLHGQVASVAPVPQEAKPWTLRDGQQNSFPFVQLRSPLCPVADADGRRNIALDRKSGNAARRAALLGLLTDRRIDAGALHGWPGDGLCSRLRERRQELASLEGTEAATVLQTLDRFLLASADSEALLRSIVEKLSEGLSKSPQESWLEIAVALLLGKFDKKSSEWRSAGALLFDTADGQLPIHHSSTAAQVSQALRHGLDSDQAAQETGTCGLTGARGRLLSGNFPQPNLPVLGQTYIFAKNKETPANDRYGRFSAAAMPVGQDTAIRLAAGIEALTKSEREGITWRRIPGEAPKQKDLLVAFVESSVDAPAVRTFVDDDAEEDFSEETSRASRDEDSVAGFEKRTQRVIEAVRAKVGGDFRQTLVRLLLLRRVDPANRKVAYSGAPSVGELYEAAKAWASGERNVPPWLTLPIIHKGDRRPVPTLPRHIAPLSLIDFSKQLFIRGGTEREEAVGLPAVEALGLFLEGATAEHGAARRRVRRTLRLVLDRRGALVAGTAHTLRRGFEFAKAFDRREALRTVTVLGVLLYKLDRTKEVYMNGTAFRLGQLLAAADVVHAGYCADVRGGDTPPALLGNQVFSTAQANPVKALAMLCRRWKPYDGWAKKAARERDRATALVASKREGERQRGWDIRTALRHAREMRPLADDLGKSLADCTVDDSFRAELLLGYIAGLPKVQKEVGDEDVDTASPEESEG